MQITIGINIQYIHVRRYQECMSCPKGAYNFRIYMYIVRVMITLSYALYWHV